MIVLFTDFGLEGPYVGQMKAVLHRDAPGVPVIDLMADVPPFRPRGAAYLLAAYAQDFPAGSVFLAVVDPGVGTVTRAPVVVEADGRYFVGPGNGLFGVIGARSPRAVCREVLWRPAHLSASFHGRDLFAPVAARLARGDSVALGPETAPDRWPDDLAEVIYIDHFGNAITGWRASALPATPVIEIAGRRIAHARTFGEVPPGQLLWYENANGLVELAANQARADALLGIGVGCPIYFVNTQPSL